MIGSRVRVYQAVTLGAKRFEKDDNGMLVKGNARHPIVEDDVVIYAGATILGRITIGKGSIIGGNVWLTTACRRAAMSAKAKTAPKCSPPAAVFEVFYKKNGLTENFFTERRFKALPIKFYEKTTG
ncbi:serine O-acetyltransferase [Methylomonas koyamae]|uniref:serine O-acetyltransferase n=1 Tax=Methylomonas koyamae TaxID=702114 RepID=UPI000A652BA5|nr:hypothetical protein [Methylomonas koyamae]